MSVGTRTLNTAGALVRLSGGDGKGHVQESGAAGLQKLRRKPFDLLILDSELHSEDGWDVLREVRSDPSLSDLKVIVFMAAKGETEKLLLVPVDAELRRPFSLGALLEAVERVIGAA